MPSPFPGMDPYLESPDLWPDVHAAMTVAIRSELNRILPLGYRASIDRYVWLHEPDSDTRIRRGKPDTAIIHSNGDSESSAVGTVVDTAPVATLLPVERRPGERYIRITDRAGRRIITVIELLSPSNKAAGEDREAYLTKRNDYLASGTSLVEIDLLRQGQRLPLGEPPPSPSDYCVLISPSAEFPRTGVWPFSVHDQLPEIPIPLAGDDRPVTLKLQECLRRVYEEARYEKEIDYKLPPDPPLPEPDAAWARELIAAQIHPVDTARQ